MPEIGNKSGMPNPYPPKFPHIRITVAKTPTEITSFYVSPDELPKDLIDNGTYFTVLLTLLQLPNGPALFGAYRDLLVAVQGLLQKLETTPRLDSYEKIGTWLKELRKHEIELRPVLAAYAQAQSLFKNTEGR